MPLFFSDLLQNTFCVQDLRGSSANWNNDLRKKTSGKDFEKKTGTEKAKTIDKREKKVDVKGTRENLKCRSRKRN